MKKKLTVNTLAFGNLKARKKQYFIMIIGIILAMIFSSGILFFISSFLETNYAKQLSEYGNQNAIIYLEGADKEYYDSLVEDGTFEKYAFAHILGFGYTDNDNQQQGAAIAWLDDEAKALSNQTFIEGSYPTQDNEIAIERNALDKLGYKDAKIGDTIKMFVKIQSGNDFFDTVERSYKLTGIVSDKRLYLNKDYSRVVDDFIPACFVKQGTETEIGGKEKLIVYANLKIQPDRSYSKLWNHIEEFEAQGKEYDTNFNSASIDVFGIPHIGICAVIIVLVLVFASCVAIVNSFNSNLQERKKQIGMLMAVGATKRQIVKIFGREAFIIALITSPFAVIISYFAVSLGLNLIDTDVVMTKSIILLPISLIVDIAVVMLASLIPLVSASKITPMQAIRDIEKNRRMKTKKIKSKKEFRISSLIAQRNLDFSKGSIIAVSVILIAAIVLSSFGFSFMQYAKSDIFDYDFDYRLGFDYSNTAFYNFKDSNIGPDEYDKTNISSINHLSKVYGCKNVGAYINIDDYTDYFRICDNSYSTFQPWDSTEGNLNYDNFYDRTRGDFSQEYTDNKKTFNESTEIFETQILSTDKFALSEIDKYHVDGEINYEKLASGEEIILVAPKKVALTLDLKGDQTGKDGYEERTVCDGEKSKFRTVANGECPYKVGDKITINVVNYKSFEDMQANPDKYEKNTKEVTIGAIISPADYKNDSSLITNTLYILTSNAGMSNFYESKKYDEFTMFCDENITPDIDESITDDLQEYVDIYNGSLISNFALVQRQQDENAALFASMVVIIIVGFSICASIINNTLSARIRESKREIGTLRAFGADLSELTKSYTLQMLSMFLWGTGIGFSVFIIGYVIIYIVCKVNERSIGLVFNPYISIMFVIMLFAVCSFNLWLKVRKEMKNSIIDNIREL